MSSFFDYKSDRIVIFKDKTMGIIYHLIILILLSFLVIYMIIIKGSHREILDTTGTLVTYFSGKTFGYNPDTKSLSFFDHGDLIDPFHAENAFFIPTELYTTQAKSGYCGRECTNDNDCSNAAPYSQAKCVNNRCQEQSLCPVGADTVSNYQIAGIENLTVKLVVLADFPGYSKSLYRLPKSNGLTMYPDENANGYTIKDLLNIAGVDYNNISTIGGAFRINVFVECNLDSNACQQKIDVKNMDIGINSLLPINNKKATLYQEKIIPHRDNPDLVDYRVFVGLQFLTNVQVTLTKFSLNKLMILIGIAFSCIALSGMIIDWVMGHTRSKEKRKAFFKAKYLSSEDFSDLKDHLEEVKRLRDQQYHQLADKEEHRLLE